MSARAPSKLPASVPLAQQRVIIGGYSPAIHSLPRTFLSTGKIIGVKRWAEDFPCDYWIGLDTGLNWRRYWMDDPKYPTTRKFLRELKVPKFMRLPNKDSEAFVPDDAGIFFQKPHAGKIPTQWDGTLQFTSSTAMAAINLGIVLGAKEIVLCGVDFVGEERADGSRYTVPGLWDQHKHEINSLVRRFNEIVPVYKTHPASWLDCPLMEIAA